MKKKNQTVCRLLAIRWQRFRTASWHGYRGNNISYTTDRKANGDQQHVRRRLLADMSSDPETLVLELLCRATLCAAETHQMHLMPTARASAHSRRVDRGGWRRGTAGDSTPTSQRAHTPQGMHTEISRPSETSGELSVPEDGSGGLK